MLPGLVLEKAALVEVAADWLVVGAWEDDADKPSSVEIIGKLVQRGDVTGKALELTSVPVVSGLRANRLMIVGLGKRSKSDVATFRDAACAALRSISTKSHDRVALMLPALPDHIAGDAAARAIGVGMMNGCFGPGLRKSKNSRFAPKNLVLVADTASSSAGIQKGIDDATVEGDAVLLARELVNLPPCDLYPESFADRARECAGIGGVECVVLDEKAIRSERMNALLGVASGSEKPPRLVLLRYRGKAGGPTLGLVGKGVTFDSGGLSLKSAEQMQDMKCDMAGAAAVLGAIVAMARQRLPVSVLGVLPLVENLPGGRALKVGDVLTARNGKTIEVLNTDAEGRLILADALAYAVDDGVDHLVDLATLTGACIVALGVEVAGLMGNDEAWLAEVRTASERAGERLWPLPMYSLYDDLIKSNVADMKNTGGSRYGGAITAAKLLEQFVGDVPWAHLDIAGPAWVERESHVRDAGGTGFGVQTLVELARAYGSVRSA